MLTPSAFPAIPGWGWQRRAVTATTTVVAADRGYTIDCTSGTYDVALDPAATLGAGFPFGVYNSGAGTITINPSGAETIRSPAGSAATLALSQGQGVLVMCDGTGFDVVAGIGLAVWTIPLSVEGATISAPTSPGGTYFGYQVAANSPGAGTYNTLIGYQCGTLLGGANTGYNNTMLGFQAGPALLDGFANTGVGIQTLQACTDGSYNFAANIHALLTLTTGVANNAVGAGSLQNANPTNCNALGMYAGRDCNGTGSLFLGHRAGMTEAGSNKLYIANNETTTLIYGDFSTGNVTIENDLSVPSGSISASGNITAGVAQIISNIVGSSRDFAWQTSGSDRWRLRCTGEAESGSNAGSNLYLNAYDDSGGYIDSPFNITRAAAGVIAWTDGRPFSFGTTTGTKLGTSATQKIGLWNATPVVQPASANQAAVAATAATNVAPYGFTTAAQADGIITLLNEIRSALVSIGAIKGSA